MWVSGPQHEKQADTIAIEVRFPAALRVTAVEQKPGLDDRSDPR